MALSHNMALEAGANYHSIVTDTLDAGLNSFQIAIDEAIGKDNVREDQLTFIVTPADAGITNAVPGTYNADTGVATITITGSGPATVECVMAQSIEW